MPIVSVSTVVLAISMPASMNINTVGELVALAKAQPGKLNAAAATGVSDFLLFGWAKKMGRQEAEAIYQPGHGMRRVPAHRISRPPSDVCVHGR